LLDVEFANSLSFFTFPCEVVGLALATLEVRFPARAEQLSAWIKGHWVTLVLDFGSVDTVRLFFGIRRTDEPREITPWVRAHPAQALALFWLGAVATFMAGAIVGGLTDANRTFADFDFYRAFAVSLGVSTLCLGAAGALWFSVSFVRGREVGSLGILIAAFAVLGEGYQFLVQALL